jgi:hypothetical protein
VLIKICGQASPDSGVNRIFPLWILSWVPSGVARQRELVD